jgi:uncharacterized protein YpmS
MRGRMTVSESRVEQQTTKNKVNIWKWAFIVLVGLLVGAVFWVYSQIQPVQIGEENTAAFEQVDSDLTFEVRTTRAQVTQVANTYLQQEMADGFVGFTFLLEEQAELHGEMEVFGFPIEFSLFMTPYVLENGNLQLRGESLNIGALNLPISFAMSQLARQVNFPEWIVIDSEEEMMIVNLNEFELENGVQFSFNRIDLVEDEIVINIHLPEEAIQ